MFLLARGDGVGDGDRARTPEQTTAAFYDALREGDCATVEAMRTNGLREQLRRRIEAGESQALDCAVMAERLATDPGLAPEVVDVQTVFREGDLSIVEVTFRLRSGAHRTSRNCVIRQPDGTWKLGVPAESEQVEAEDLPPDLRPEA